MTSSDVSVVLSTQQIRKANEHGLQKMKSLQNEINKFEVLNTINSFSKTTSKDATSTNFLLSRLNSVLSSIPDVDDQTHSILMTNVRVTMMERCRRQELTMLFTVVQNITTDLIRTKHLIQGNVIFKNKKDKELFLDMKSSILSTTHTGSVPQKWIRMIQDMSGINDANNANSATNTNEENGLHINVWMYNLRQRIEYVSVQLKKNIDDHRKRNSGINSGRNSGRSSGRSSGRNSDEEKESSNNNNDKNSNTSRVLHGKEMLCLKPLLLYRPDVMINAFKLSFGKKIKCVIQMEEDGNNLINNAILALDGLFIKNAYLFKDTLMENIPVVETEGTKNKKNNSSNSGGNSNSLLNNNNNFTVAPRLFFVDVENESTESTESKKRNKEKMYSAPVVLSKTVIGTVELKKGSAESVTYWLKRGVHLTNQKL